jgi:uncharacterized repeat protein (TIGR03803 family)
MSPDPYFPGMTRFGSGGTYGTIFSINTDGTGYSLLHGFSGSSTDGRGPYGSLVLSGSKLYGMTEYGGSGGGLGTIFSMNTDGTGFGLVHSFAGGSSDGSQPYDSLTLAGSKLYGITSAGGSSDKGTIFSVNTDGTGFSLLHSFTGSSADGRFPQGSLTLSASKLYGMTNNGGSSDSGTIFGINTDGTGFNLLHSFTGGATDGQSATGSLTLFGSKLYGMTDNGGISDKGTIFSIDTDGTDFSLLHSFSGGSSDGGNSDGSLTLYGTKLYGMTRTGGSSNQGVIFNINTDGTGFGVIESFVGSPSDGSAPFGDLTLSTDGQTLYGMTYTGGAADLGVIFSAPAPEPSTCAMLGLGLTALATARRRKL